MSSIYIHTFKGMQPKIAGRLLPDYNAQVAANVKLNGGNLQPLRGVATHSAPNKQFPAKSLYIARLGDSFGWLTWPFDVDVVRSPLPSEVEPRYYWSGDGEPRYGRFSDVTSGGLNNYPSAYFALGIPSPVLECTVTPSGGVGSTVTRFYCHTFFSALGEESGPSPISAEVSGKVDGTWAIADMDVFPANIGSGTASHVSGTTTFTNGSSVKHWLRVGDVVVIAGTDVVVTGIPTTDSFTVAGNFTGATTWARKAPWNTVGMKRRLYRTTGTLGSFQLVADDVGTTYNDTLTDANILGDALITSGWAPPDPGLKGLVAHSSGSLVAFKGTQIMFSEPYQPHAWVRSYTLATDYEIVSIATFGSDIAVGTKGVPSVATGVDPASMTLQKIGGLYPCLSKRSMVSVGDGAVYASGQGLIYIGMGGVRVFTEQSYTKEAWLKENPESMVCEFAYGRIYIATLSSDGRPYVLILEGDAVTSASVEAYELYADPATSELYVGTLTNVGVWDSSAEAPLPGTWRSKIFVSPNQMNMGAAKVEFDEAVDEATRAAALANIADLTAANQAMVTGGTAEGQLYNVKGYNAMAFNGSLLADIPPEPASNIVGFTLFSKGAPVFSKVVTDNKAFRLPAGYKADELEVQVNSQCTVNAIRIGETMRSLQDV